MEKPINSVKEKNIKGTDIITLFKMLWIPEKVDNSIDIVAEDLSLTEKERQELRESQKNIKKLEDRLMETSAKKRRSKTTKTKTEFQTHVGPIRINEEDKEDIEQIQEDNKMNEKEKDR